ncbi:hypothetical protein LQZ21_09885 [Treponema sp. TIM-1]|uniref:hypothetical protein n=1 Tax=Treponema sp. TIM-1 TaxID=2898417 RepID=UPI0039803EB6
MKQLSYIAALLAVYLSGTPLFASGVNETREISPFFIPSTRNLALGGPHVAYTEDINSLFINPAVFGTVKQLSAAELSLGIYGDSLGLMDIMKNINDANKLADTFSHFITRSNGNIPLGFDLRGPIAIGSIKNGWGWGVFDRFYGGTQVTGKSIRAWSKADFMFNLGYSMRVMDVGVHTIDVGIVAKLFNRLEINSGQIPLTELLFNDNALMAGFNFAPFTVGTGMDMGLQYRLIDNFTVGLTVNDLFSLAYVTFQDLNLYSHSDSPPAGYFGYVEPTVNLGVSYKIFDNPLLSWAVMADYRDFAGLFWQQDYTVRNGWLNLSLGTELTLFKRLALRAGMNDMLPSVGVGFDLVIFKLDAAFYGKELSNEPGGLSTYAMDLGLLFRY